jgi:hypothetical protein
MQAETPKDWPTENSAWPGTYKEYALYLRIKYPRSYALCKKLKEEMAVEQAKDKGKPGMEAWAWMDRVYKSRTVEVKRSTPYVRLLREHPSLRSLYHTYPWNKQ